MILKTSLCVIFLTALTAIIVYIKRRRNILWEARPVSYTHLDVYKRQEQENESAGDYEDESHEDELHGDESSENAALNNVIYSEGDSMDAIRCV